MPDRNSTISTYGNTRTNTAMPEKADPHDVYHMIAKANRLSSSEHEQKEPVDSDYYYRIKNAKIRGVARYLPIPIIFGATAAGLYLTGSETLNYFSAGELTDTWKLAALPIALTIDFIAEFARRIASSIRVPELRQILTKNPKNPSLANLRTYNSGNHVKKPDDREEIVGVFSTETISVRSFFKSQSKEGIPIVVPYVMQFRLVDSRRFAIGDNQFLNARDRVEQKLRDIVTDFELQDISAQSPLIERVILQSLKDGDLHEAVKAELANPGSSKVKKEDQFKTRLINETGLSAKKLILEKAYEDTESLDPTSAVARTEVLSSILPDNVGAVLEAIASKLGDVIPESVANTAVQGVLDIEKMDLLLKGLPADATIFLNIGGEQHGYNPAQLGRMLKATPQQIPAPEQETIEAEAREVQTIPRLQHGRREQRPLKP